jgi:hypothetical protein
MAQFRTDTKKYSTGHDVTRHEVFMLSDRLTPSGTLTDAFGRIRVANPLTLFDSTHRYFGAENGIYFENDGTTNYLVLRTFTNSSVSETRVAQSNWNVDKFDGTGYSAQGTGTEHQNGLDVSKSNIFWTDVEWLGVGDVRAGFVIDGKPCVAHIFHNDNTNTLPYMTTACLPIRYEIKNNGVVSDSSTLKQICSTVISEGGYSLFGRQKTAFTPVTSAKDLPTAGTLYPIVSIRLKSNRLDAVAIVTALSVLGIGNNTKIRWSLVEDTSLTSANWTSAGSDSAVEYDISATAMSGGTQRATGFIGVTNQSTAGIEIPKEQLFRFQLERNGLTNTPTIFTLAAAGAANGDDVLGSIDWEEIVN